MNTIEMMSNASLPVPGDISICGACGAFHEFDGLLNLIKPSPARMRAIKNTPALQDLQERLIKRK
jgi:hypothetical protein